MKSDTTWHTKLHINSNIMLQSKHFMHDINYLAAQNFKKLQKIQPMSAIKHYRFLVKTYYFTNRLTSVNI